MKKTIIITFFLFLLAFTPSSSQPYIILNETNKETFFQTTNPYVQLKEESNGFCSLNGCTINGTLIIGGEVIIDGNVTINGNLTVNNITYNNQIINTTVTIIDYNVTGNINATGWIYANQNITTNSSLVGNCISINETEICDWSEINATASGGSDNLGDHIARQNVTNVTNIVGINQTSYQQFNSNGDIIFWI